MTIGLWVNPRPTPATQSIQLAGLNDSTGLFSAWESNSLTGFTDPANEDVTAMAAFPGLVYVATVSAVGNRPIRIYKTDGVANLTQVFSVDQTSSTRERVKRIYIERGNNLNVWLAVGPFGTLTSSTTVRGLYRATDGVTFIRVGTGIAAGGADRLSDLVIRETPTRRIWTLAYSASLAPRLSYSDDDGVSFTNISGFSGNSSREGMLQLFPRVTGNTVVAHVNWNLAVGGTTQHNSYETVDGVSPVVNLGGFAQVVLNFWGSFFEPDTQHGFSLSNDSGNWRETFDHATTWSNGTGWLGGGTSHKGSLQESHETKEWAFAIANTTGLRTYIADVDTSWGSSSVPDPTNINAATWVKIAGVAPTAKPIIVMMSQR